MGGWNRSRYVRRQPPDRSRRPPLPPPDYGQNHCPVPLWEREFCSYVGNISWQRFCENKQYVWGYHNIEQWDDSGALENFQNAKARFWAYYHGRPSDIPLPDRDMFIDEVDHRCKVDPELVADLDKVQLPFDSDNNPAPASAGADSKCAQNGSGNWDIYIEKPAEVNKWELEASLRPDAAAWGTKAEPSDRWDDTDAGWSAPLEKPGWRGWSKNRYSVGDRSNNDNRCSEEERRPSYASGRKRNGSAGCGWHSQQRSNKQRSQDEGLQQRRGSNSWQDHNGRDRWG
ncbi:hypothetical protein BS78_K047500 [Paspalum vaginatum]|uniref:Uncharacterized protein n=1 Tax=Paspalum vaginatum TaxID=158149 RepID=A0A9W8CEE3_9POAL|nr:hypothetical protein BS78_K047500 [Paspalum vaginatum]